MKKERLFSRSKGSLQETTSFHLIASQHRFAKRPKVEGGQSSWPKYIKTVHLVFCESFNGRRNKYRGRFHLEKRGDILDMRCIKDFLEPVCNETFGKKSMAFCSSSWNAFIPKVAKTCLKTSSVSRMGHCCGLNSTSQVQTKTFCCLLRWGNCAETQRRWISNRRKIVGVSN